MHSKKISIAVCLYLTLSLLSISSQAAPGSTNAELFVECAAAFSRNDFLPLKALVENTSINNQNIRPYQCLSLNNHQFLVTGEGQIYFIDTDRSLIEDAEMGRWWPNVELLSQVLGPSRKTFVLFKVARLHQGMFGSGYSVFFIKPGKDKESYAFQFLDGDAFLDDDSDAYNAVSPSKDSCERNTDGRWSIDKPQKVEGPALIEGNSKILLTVHEFDCRTMSTKTIDATYSWDKKNLKWNRQEVIRQ